MYTAPASANLYDLGSADLAAMIFPLNIDTPESQKAAAALPATVEGLASRFALQAFRNSYYDAGKGAWQVSHDRGRTWAEDTALNYAGGLLVGIIANMILWEPTCLEADERKQRRQAGYDFAKQPGIYDQVLTAAQALLTEPYVPGEGDEMPANWKPREIDYDSVGCADLEDWWTEGRYEHFRLTGMEG